MNKNTVLKVKNYLEERGIIDIDNEESKMDQRAKGREFPLSEHIQGIMLLSDSGGYPKEIWNHNEQANQNA